MKKLVVRGSLVVLAVIVILVVVLIFSINSIVRSAISSAGSSALGVKTTVGSVSIGIFSGRSELSNLSIENPEGFSGDFLKLSDGMIDLNIGSLFSDKVTIKEIALDGLSVEFLQKLDKSNVSVILDNVDKSTGGDETADQEETQSSERKFVIDQLKVTNVKVTIGIEPLSSATKPSTLTIDEIIVNDIGKKENGVTLAEVSGVVVQAIVNAVLSAAPGQIPSLMLQGIQGGLSNLTHLDFGSVQFDAGKGLSTIAEGFGGALDNIGKGISDLIDGDKKGSDSKSEDSRK